jgi:hypothetical protein
VNAADATRARAACEIVLIRILVCDIVGSDKLSLDGLLEILAAMNIRIFRRVRIAQLIRRRRCGGEFAGCAKIISRQKTGKK